MKAWQTIIPVFVLAAGRLAATAQEYVPLGAPAIEPFPPAAGSPMAFPLPSAVPGTVPTSPSIESTWYTRIDYFHWNERIDHQSLVNENGPLVTLGYLRRVGNERFRAEFFDSSVRYKSFIQNQDGSIDPLLSTTNYIGLRGEYDLLYDPEWWPAATLFAGVGTRFWLRDLPDSVTVSGKPVSGYLETWWTTYPYLGIQRRREIGSSDIEFFASGRVGATAVTFQHVSWDDVVLYPKIGITGQLETGVRGPRFFVSAFSELLTWGQSAVVRGYLQPASSLVTVGLRTGFTF
jgi:hypothetical protein